MKLKRFFRVVLLVALVKVLYAFNSTIGFFKIPYRNSKVSACARTILLKKEHLYGSVNEVTGNCNGLSSKLSNKNINDTGYAFFKKLSFEELFYPPVAPKTVFTVPAWKHVNAVLSLAIEMPIAGYRYLNSGNLSCEEYGILYYHDNYGPLFISCSLRAEAGATLYHGNFGKHGNCTFMVARRKTRISFEIQAYYNMVVTFGDGSTCTLFNDKLRNHVSLSGEVYAARITYG